MDKQSISISAVLVCLVMALVLAPGQIVLANEIVVDSRCTLAEAIGSANNNSSKARCEKGFGDDTIKLKKSVELEDELPKITSNITIEGNGHTLHVPRQHRAFVIEWGHLTIKNLRVKFNSNKGETPPVKITNGSITIIDSTMIRCQGRFKIEKSKGIAHGSSNICGYSAAHVNSWFGGAAPAATAVPASANPSAPFTCDVLNATSDLKITAPLGLRSGIQCQRVNASGIGIQSVINAGIIDAVDLWGYIEQGVEICFPRQGTIIFLDATTSPRTQVPVSPFALGGITCVVVNRPGTVVLVPGQAPAREPAVPAQPSAGQSAETVAPPAQECRVTTTGNLNLRASPAMGENIIGYVPRGLTLTPITWTTYWYNVEHQGTTGWISASPRYTHVTEACL